MTKHVIILSENDYGKSAVIATYGGLDNVYIFYAPKERFSGIPLFLYKVHNTPKINNIVKLPLRKQWAKVFIPKAVQCDLLETDDIVFYFSGIVYMYAEIGLFEYLRKKYRNCKLVYSFADRVDLYRKYEKFDFQELLVTFDLVCTYNEADAQTYGIKQKPPVLLDYGYVPDDPSVPETDVFFIGREKGRLNRLLHVYEVCVSHNLKCVFYITDVADEKQMYTDRIVYNQYMAYDEAMKRAKKAKCIVNLIQSNASGITLRDYEAISMNKVLITDNKVIKDFSCYSEEKVIMYDKLENELNKITGVQPETQWNHPQNYSARAYLDWVERQIRR